jgi:multidrug efflux pump subunit AcrA (membrane-fusion protein)
VVHALAVLVAVTCVACSRPQQGAPPRGPASVTVISITPRDVAVGYEFVAQTQSSRAVNIQARVSGFLDRRVYTEGSLVKEGQVLFLMDKKPFQAQLDQAKAALQQQQAAMETAQANLTRTKPLVEQDALSQKDLDDAKGQYLQNAAPSAGQAAGGPGAAQPVVLHDHLTGGRRVELRAAGRWHLYQLIQQSAHDGVGALAHVGELQHLGEPVSELSGRHQERAAQATSRPCL